jgi:hypothetical protein
MSAPYRVTPRCVATVQNAFGYLANSLHAAFLGQRLLNLPHKFPEPPLSDATGMAFAK